MNKKYTVLIVEDEIINIEILKEMLGDTYFLKIADTGAKAVELMSAELPDLVILDMLLPDCSGIEICRKFKEDKQTSHIPIIIATSLKDKEDKIRGLEAGANDYLLKPIDKDELLLKVKNHLITKELRDQLNSSLQGIAGVNKELKKINEKKSEFLGIAAHDMRNSLTVIMGRTELLLMKTDKDSKDYSNLKTIKQSADYLINLIKDLLNTVTIESGQIKPNKKKINLEKLAKEVIDLNISVAKSKNQKLKFSHQNNCFVLGDTMMLRGIMDNLISNGIKFSPPDTTIYIDITREKETIRFIVTDEGPGLTEEDKKKVFGRFQRLSAKPTGGESSTGLGLSIVKDYVEMHDGTITVESKRGEGCKFTVSLLAV